MAVTGQSDGAVFHSNQPDKVKNCITVFADNEEVNVHNTVTLAKYQAIVRNEDQNTCETLARLILEAEYEGAGLAVYYGMYLTAAIGNTGTSVTFAPDNGSGTSTAARFATNDYILINSEVMKVTGVTGNNVTATRAQLGTTIAAHADNDFVHNITKNPIPGKQCGSTFMETGLFDLGNDGRGAYEISVNWTVRVKR
ncbi:MAG: hypothetical protein RBT66_09060 [bacterium]|nr:hypothetical protein [bacterium]